MQDKVVLITGGAVRVGAAIARSLHATGARIMIHYRSSADDAEKLRDELNKLRPDSSATVQGDLLDLACYPKLVEAAEQQFGRLDVLINNASSFYPTAVGEITEQDWFDLVGTNLKAPLFLSQAAANALTHSHGCIVNIADIHAERPMKSYVVYSLAKAGLVALTKSLAHELGPQVRVNAVAPGPIMWPEDDPTLDDQERRRIIAHTLLKREGSPDDIAKAVTFLVNDAPYITGVVLPVDGGRSASL
ncbi:MAG: pteridine reductase [Sulfurimicrobium sp.]|nr:pteridine reductase [Sulfurimicrobium sp.]